MIYFVEDDNSIRELVVYTLNNSGLEAEGFPKPSEFWLALEEKAPTLVLLDIMLPEEDGLSILKKLRSAVSTRQMPVMLLTAKGSEYDKIVGLDLGADDYLPKPFGMMELVARAKALIRRSNYNDSSNVPNKTYTLGDLFVNPSSYIAKVDGKQVILTQKEFEILCMLFENQGIVLTRDKLLTEIWKYEYCGESRTVDVHIRTLRKKLGSGGNCIETVHGIGYKIGGKQ